MAIAEFVKTYKHPTHTAMRLIVFTDLTAQPVLHNGDSGKSKK